MQGFIQKWFGQFCIIDNMIRIAYVLRNIKPMNRSEQFKPAVLLYGIETIPIGLKYPRVCRFNRKQNS